MQSQTNYVSFVETLPIGAYQVDAEGRIVYCNSAFARIFGYDGPSDLISKNILDFYPDKLERERLISSMRDKSGVRVNETLYLKNRHGVPLIVSDSFEILYDTQDRAKEVGVRGVMMDLGYMKLLDRLNTGIYATDAEDRIVKVNRAVARILGFDHPYQLEGINVAYLCKNKSDLMELNVQLEESGMVENFPVAMLKRNGEEVIISVTASVVRDREDRVIGREGIFTDITNLHRIRDILERMPTGAYQVEYEQGTPRICYCNHAFAQMFGYSTQEMCGMDMGSLYASRDDAGSFDRALQDAYREGQPLRAYELCVTDRAGKKFWIELDCFAYSDHKGNIIGRLGTIRDITTKRKLEAILRGTRDVQRFAHRFMAPMMSIHANTEVMLEELERVIDIEIPEGRRKNFRGLSRDGVGIARAIREATGTVLGGLQQLTALLEEELNLVAYKRQLNEHAEKLKALIGRHQIENSVELHQATRDLADSLFSLTNAVEDKLEVKRVSSGLLTRLGDLDKFYILQIAQLTANTAKIAYLEVENLRAHMLRWQHAGPEAVCVFRVGSLYDCILEVINIYQIYAVEKGIKIVVRRRGSIPRIEMSEQDIKWMLHYLLQNAVKYSFRREGLVKVVVEAEATGVTIEIENYGVGILPEEISDGKIFEHGYRGKLSGDWNRLGSGIGLYEALRIAQAHGGQIVVSSRPVSGYKDEINKNTPYITRVRVSLPSVQGKAQHCGDRE